MAIATTRTAKIEGAIVWRLIAALVLLAFSFQSYLAQTHIHETAATTSAALIHHPGPNKSPVDNSPLDCPFCQAVAHATGFLVPGALLPFLAPGWVKITTLHNLLADKGTATRHSWQSRAPPSRR
jgi:hypothetical protein